MTNSDVKNHVMGHSKFIADISVPQNCFELLICDSTIAHGKIKSINLDDAINTSGIKAILTAQDIPGTNQVGAIIEDETLLADDVVDFIGQPIAVIVADKLSNARVAKSKIKIEYIELEPIVDARKAFEQNKLITNPVTYQNGDVDSTWEKCNQIIEGRVDTGGQEHLYLETQGAIVIPTDVGGLKIISSTQSPTSVQRSVAKILGLPMNLIEVDVARLGGGFGGKEDQASIWACLCALAAWVTKQPTRLILDRLDDLRMTGGRHPYSSDYKIGFDKEGKILAYQVTYYQNSGAAADLSTAILERSLFHATNSYYVPNVKATGICCKTNLVPNTAFRGFGGPQAMFVIESALHKASLELGIPYSILQKKNLIKKGEKFYYGQTVKTDNADRCFNELNNQFDIENKRKEIEEFNKQSKFIKKGASLIPVTFGISFTNSFMNQASALVHIYTDGSVGISTAAVEMGQGVNQKLRDIAAKEFSINIDRVKIESTNTTRVANTSPTAASSAADLNGNALLVAIKKVKYRLYEFLLNKVFTNKNAEVSLRNETVYFDDTRTEMSWQELIQKAFLNRINLSAYGSYSTPNLNFNRDTCDGNPFAYHTFGAAFVSATVDCLKGTYEFDEIDVVHDIGESLNTKVDIGQIEGGIAQGIGWLTCEELNYSEQGNLLANALSTYKAPDIYSVPKKYNIKFLTNSKNNLGPFNSKAIGEPPFMYGIAGYFALLNAVEAFDDKFIPNYKAPLTPENLLLQIVKDR